MKTIKLNEKNTKEMAELSTATKTELGAEFINAIVSSVSIAKKKKIAEKLAGEKTYAAMLKDPKVRAALDQIMKNRPGGTAQ
jgi:uncharacterized protein YjgD (DUF1641 family)